MYVCMSICGGLYNSLQSIPGWPSSFPPFTVSTLMCLHIRFITKVFATHITLEGFLSCVRPCVNGQRTMLGEGFGAHCTFVGFFSGVDSHV